MPRTFALCFEIYIINNLKIKKMIDYILEDNPLTEDPNDRTARVVNTQPYNEEDLADAIAKRNIGISKSETLAVLEAAADIKKEWIEHGDTINLRLEHYHYTIPGAYREGDYPKEAVMRITPSKELTDVVKKISLRNVEPSSRMRIEFVNDVKSATTNDKITPGGVVKIAGYNLKLAGTDVSVGLTFVSMTNPNTAYSVPIADIFTNNPSELMFIAPAMTPGEEVQLKITTQFAKGSKTLNAPRSVTFERKLTVV
jgi:hypothetical protein